MQKQLSDGDEYTELECESCGEMLTDASEVRDEDECIHCFVNYDCPDGCNEEHDEPTPNDYGQWSCPTTGNLYTLNGGSWELQDGRYHDSSTYVALAGEWYIYPSEEGYNYCDNCDAWRYDEDMHYDSWGDYTGCTSCRGDYDEDEGCSRPASGIVQCDGCGTSRVTITHWDPMTEHVYGDCCAARGVAIPVLAAVAA